MSISGEFESEINNSPDSNSFWEIKQYGRCVRRVENGNKLCSDICNMIQDRVEIEKIYSASLHKWSSKWSAYLDNGSEYGSTKASWMGWCNEAEALSEVHKSIRNKLVEEIQTEVRNWQKDHHHKSALPPQHLKEAKSLESEFEIAQKPWSKKLKKINQCKKDFHQQSKMLRTYEVQIKNLVNDNNLSQDQLKKIEEKVKKAEKDTDKLKNLYELSLQDLDADRSRYVDDMTKVFTKSQLMERDRMTFFKSIFFRIQKVLNLSENESLPDIYSTFEKTIASIDPDVDLKQWSESYGADMAFICPQFEEYTQEPHSISKKKSYTNNDAGVTLTAVKPSSRQASIRSGDTGSRSAVSPSTGTEPSTPSPNPDSVTPICLSRPESCIEDEMPPSKPRRLTSTDKSSPLDEPKSSGIENNESPVFSDEAGVQVRALYDYNGLEEDELTLKQGEIFLKLEDEDEQGWCKGKKDGRIGLYPANYAETV